MPEVIRVADPANRLGESPAWHPVEHALYWVDIERPSVERLEPDGSVRRWPMPEMIGSIAFRKGGGLVAAMRSGFHFLDLESGTVDPIVDPEPDRPDHRFNDGKCDRRGRFWSGTLDLALRRDAREGTLYRLDPDGSCHAVVSGLSTTNGLGWSPDDRILYLADSRADVVYAFDFDADTGGVDNRRVFFTTDSVTGRVDGAAVDSDGCYWCAMFDGGCVARYDPDGRRMTTIAVPERYPTMCSFGGMNNDVLYVTTASRFASPPAGGGLYAVLDCGARGLPEALFAG